MGAMMECVWNPGACANDMQLGHISDTAKFVDSFFFSLISGSLLLCLFVALHFSPKTKLILEPRIYRQTTTQPFTIAPKRSSGLSVRDIASLDDEPLMAHIGLDGLVFLLFLRSCTKICLLCSLIALVVLLPTYATEPVSRRKFESNDFLDALSIQNLNDGSWRLWLPVLAACAFTLCSIKILYDDGSHVADLVDKHLARRHVSHYTVMLTDIPPRYRSQSTLHRLLQTIYPEKIEKLHVIQNTTRLHALRKQRERCRQKLADAIAFEQSQGHRPRVLIYGSFPSLPAYADSIEHHRARASTLKRELEALLIRPKYASTAFVHFADLVTTSCAVSTQIFANTMHFKSALAPYPEDLVVANLRFSEADNFAAQTLINVLVFALVLVWILLVNGSAMLSHIDGVFKYVTHRDLLLFVPQNVVLLVSGTIPTILIKLWLSLLPRILRLIYALGVQKDASKRRLQLLNKYYLMLILMVLLSLVITHTVSASLERVIVAVENIFATLALSLSKSSTLFIQYLMITTFIFDPLTLLYPLQFRYVDSLFIESTETESHEGFEFDFVYFYANLSLELIITVTYSVCSPLILAFALMHFLMSSLIFKRQLITYYASSCSMGRFVWIDLLQNIVYGLYLPIGVVIGIVILKSAWFQALALLALLLFIVQIQSIIHINTKLSSSFKCVCLQTAAKIDARNRFRRTFRVDTDAFSDDEENGQTQYHNHNGEQMTFESCYIPSQSKM